MRKQLWQNYSHNKDYPENFESRLGKIVDFISSYSILIYPKFMILNKTQIEVICQDQRVHGYKSIYLNKRDNNNIASFRCHGYSESQSFDISTIGLAGSFTLEADKKKFIM